MDRAGSSRGWGGPRRPPTLSCGPSGHAADTSHGGLSVAVHLTLTPPQLQSCQSAPQISARPPCGRHPGWSSLKGSRPKALSQKPGLGKATELGDLRGQPQPEWAVGAELSSRRAAGVPSRQSLRCTLRVSPERPGVVSCEQGTRRPVGRGAGRALSPPGRLPRSGPPSRPILSQRCPRRSGAASPSWRAASNCCCPSTSTWSPGLLQALCPRRVTGRRNSPVAARACLPGLRPPGKPRAREGHLGGGGQRPRGVRAAPWAGLCSTRCGRGAVLR